MWLLALALLADTVHTFSLALSPAESVAVTVTGTGDPVVLVPGLFGSAFGYRAVIPLLTDAGYRAIVVEPLGIGSSARPEHADYSLTAQADRIAAALDRLSVRHAIVVAHSLGASMAFRLAYRRPDLVAGIVSLDGGPAERAATRSFRRAMTLAPWIKLFGGVKLVRRKIRGQLIKASGDPSWVSERVVDGYTAGAATTWTRPSRRFSPWRSGASRSGCSPISPRCGAPSGCSSERRHTRAGSARRKWRSWPPRSRRSSWTAWPGLGTSFTRSSLPWWSRRCDGCGRRRVCCLGPRRLVTIPRAMTNRLLLGLILVVASGDLPVPRSAPDASGARIFMDERAGTLVLDLAPIDLPANTPHHALAQPPVATLEIPENGFIYGFRVQVVDSAGHALPDELIHHFNLIDPDHRELFLPISRRLLAAGHETGTIRLPRLLFGLPLKRGEHVVASGMVENLTPAAYRRARVRLVMSFTPAKRPWPLFSASPWQMDVAFPVGDKSFTLPPGRSARSYEGSPAVRGTIVGLGGHMHDYGRVIEFADVTTGEVIYRAAPVADSGGHIESIPIAMLFGWTRRGVHID